MKPCEVCGATETQKSHLSPMGFIKMTRSKGFFRIRNVLVLPRTLCEQCFGILEKTQRQTSRR